MQQMNAIKALLSVSTCAFEQKGYASVPVLTRKISCTVYAILLHSKMKYHYRKSVLHIYNISLPKNGFE